MHLTFVLLPTPSDLDGAAIVASHAALFPADPRPLVASSDAGIVMLRAADGLATTIAMMPGAVPDGEAEGVAQCSLAAFSPAGGPPAPHAAHVIVTTSAADGRGSVDTLLRHTRAVAACVDALGASAIYEGNARATHPTGFYLDVVKTMSPPLMLWTGVSIAHESPTRTSILTLGIQNMVGLPDMLVGVSRANANEALSFLFDILLYVVRRGQPLPNGDTIGRTAEEKLKVSYVVSPVDATRKVVRIDLP
ncbi:MAG: DUF4261 domain-containing protein [Deltaproteobacteria bacterium]|nr:DUF4261 domain-containing protein [Deltaproteobacteria bacterium]